MKKIKNIFLHEIKRKLNKKTFTLIELTIVLVIIAMLFSIIFWINFWWLTLSKNQLIWIIVNKDNVYLKWDWNILKICNIELTWDINNTYLLKKNCVDRSFFKPIVDWIDMYKVQWVFVNSEIEPINYTHRNIFIIKNWVLFLK